MSRRTELTALAPRYDLVIIGGGITGAGVLREAVRTGARVLLVEQGDFASGTSSWSSKLVHGGLRYLKTGQWRLTLESVRERQRLLNEAPGLIDPQPFLMPLYRGVKPGKLVMRIGLFLYDLMAGSQKSHGLSAAEARALEPGIRAENLSGAVSYEDARTDDARLVLRLILDSTADGATALNYVRAKTVETAGRTAGVELLDLETGGSRSIEAGLVINATGAWAGSAAGAPALRPLRGSHFVFPLQKLPLKQAVSWLHPRDQRPVFAYPWEGAVVYGTTDLDHGEALESPRISPAESAYLLEGLDHQFPVAGLKASDAVATYAGVRPVVAGGKGDPSAESRESAMWSRSGLVCITGGKLTTFRVTAREVLREASRQLPVLAPRAAAPVFSASEDRSSRLHGRLGSAAARQVLAGIGAEQEKIAHTPYSWAELRWSARHEWVVHLQDLLMRRTRIGLVMEQGGTALWPRIKDICQQELGWDDQRWSTEEKGYKEYWRRQHAPL